MKFSSFTVVYVTAWKSGTFHLNTMLGEGWHVIIILLVSSLIIIMQNFKHLIAANMWNNLNSRCTSNVQCHFFLHKSISAYTTSSITYKWWMALSTRDFSSLKTTSVLLPGYGVSLFHLHQTEPLWPIIILHDSWFWV